MEWMDEWRAAEDKGPLAYLFLAAAALARYLLGVLEEQGVEDEELADVLEELSDKIREAYEDGDEEGLLEAIEEIVKIRRNLSEGL